MSDYPDCGDHSCFFAAYRKDNSGMRTNGGCKCKPHDVKRAFYIQSQKMAEMENILYKLSVLAFPSSDELESLRNEAKSALKYGSSDTSEITFD